MKLAQEIVMFSFILVLLVGIGSCVNIAELPSEDPDPTASYDVTFTIRDASGPLQGALVRISGSEKTSGSDGRAAFTLTGSNQAQTYAVTMDGYRSVVGSIVVDRDVARTITLQPYDDTPDDQPGEEPPGTTPDPGTPPVPPELEQARIATLTVSGEETENPGANAFDDDRNTRWSADVELNDGEQYLELTFAEAIEVGSVRIWWYNGVERTTDYAISTGTGQSRTVHSEGTAQQALFHDYAIGETVTVLRITGFGNSQNEWASISEVQINGQAPDTTDMSVTVLDSGNEDPNTDVCLSDDDCLEGYLCTSEGECVAVQTGCTDDTECESGEACMNGACVPIDTGCTDDTECESGLVCSSEGTCVEETISVVFVPECGSANGTYPHTQTDYEYTGATTFCANGLPSPSDIAYPAPGATVNWQCVSGNCEVQGTFTDQGQDCEIETVSCSATREAAPEQSMSRLTLKKAGIGGVTSTSDPNQDAQFNCNALRCTGQSVEYPVGTRVTFTPEPGDGYEFGGWSENCEQLSEGRCAITIDETNPTVTATFEEIAPAPTNYVAWTYIKRCVWGCRIETDTFSGKLVPGQTESHEGTYTIFPLLQPSCGLTIKVTNTDGKISCSEHYRWGDACDEYAFACSEGTDRTAPDMPEEPDQQPAPTPTPTPTPTPEPEPPVEPTGQVTFSIKEYNSMGTEVDVSARVLIGIPYKKDGYIGLYNAIQDKTGAEVQFDLAPGTYWYTSWGPDGQRFIGSITVAADKEYERKILFPRAMTGMGQYSTNRFSVTIRDQKLDGTDAQPLSGTEVEWGGRPIGTTGSMGKIMQEDMEDNSGKAMLTTDSGYRYDALSFVLTMNAGMEVGLDLEVYPRGKSPPYQPPTSPDLFITRLPPPP